MWLSTTGESTSRPATSTVVPLWLLSMLTLSRKPPICGAPFTSRMNCAPLRRRLTR